MKLEDDRRLEDVDPEFARLVSALRGGGPSSAAMTRALDAVEKGAQVSPLASGLVPRTTRPVSYLPWIGAGTLVLVLSAAAYQWSRVDAPREAPAATATATATSPSPRARIEAPAEGPTSTVRVEDLPPAEAARAEAPGAAPPKAQPSSKIAAGGKPATTLESAPTADAFRDELTQVERIRTQLSRGETAACLRSIDQYAERFAGGAFVQEVEVMRVEALATSGDGERARVVGQRFLAQYPTSPYAARVRSVLDKTK